MAYVRAAIETDTQALLEDMVALLRDRVPGWEPSDAALEFILMEIVADVGSENRDVASDVPDAIFLTLGQRFYGIPLIAAANATVAATVTAIDDAGYTVEEGAVFGVRAAGDELFLFEVEEDVVIPPGETTTAPGAVALIAQEPGADASGIGGAGADAEPVDSSLAWVQSAVLSGATEGGADVESEEAYLDRLAEELQLQTPRPILPRDFAVLYRRVPGVYRALALDLYKPADQPNPGDPAETDRERSLTLVGIDEAGEAADAAARAAGVALLSSMRETTFEVWATDPTYTTVDVDFEAVAYPGWDPADVEARAVEAVAEWLSPARWGNPDADADPRQWIVDDSVREYELAEQINRVQGLWRITSLTLNKAGDPPASADVPLAGAAPLTRPGAITGSVAAP